MSGLGEVGGRRAEDLLASQLIVGIRVVDDLDLPPRGRRRGGKLHGGTGGRVIDCSQVLDLKWDQNPGQKVHMIKGRLAGSV